MDLDVEGVRPSLGIQALESVVVRGEAIQQIAVDRVEPAVNLAVVRVENHAVKADPPLAPVLIGDEVAIVPPPDDPLLPAAEAVVTKDVCFNLGLPVHECSQPG